MGRLRPSENKLITMRDLVTCGLLSSAKEGVKLLSRVKMHCLFLYYTGFLFKLLFIN